MTIEIKQDVFETAELQDELRKILQDFNYKRRYDYYIDITGVETTETYGNLYDTNKDLIKEYFNKQNTENNKIDYYISNAYKSENTFSLGESIKFFNQPIQIILENSNNDSYFIDAIINNFKKSSKKIKRFKQENWITYAMGGGADNIINLIEAEKKNNNGDTKFLKCFVLVDSDLEYPVTPNPKRKTLQDYLNNNKIPYHILEKREMENYIPDDVIEKISVEDKFIETYLKIKPSQKDFIDLEKGFQENRKALEKNRPKVFNHYHNLDDQEIDNLKYGLRGLFKNFKSEFPVFFEQATQEGLLERTKYQEDPKELQNILNKINSIL